MEITIDLSQIPTDNPLATAWYLFISGGWVAFAIVFLWAGREAWFGYIRTKYRKRWEWSVLSIKIPKLTEQYAKAVEYIFASLAGTYKHVDWIENWFLGKHQVEFSFELVSREGYLEYLIRTPRHYRDLVEATVYAQYPDAEISEVPDYTDKYMGIHWPDNDGGYDIWGTALKLIKKEYYPIKTYPQFFDIDAKKGFRDPVYGMLEILSKLRRGEEFWFQIVVAPTDNKKWQHKALAYAKHALGQSTHHDSILSSLVQVLLGVVDAIIYAFIDKPEVEVGKEDAPQMLKKEQAAIEAIQEKASKMVFKAKLRAVYIAKKEVFNKSKIKEAFLGVLNQYHDLYTNGFYQDKYSKVSTSHLYYFAKYRVDHYRKNIILHKYHKRSMRYGGMYNKGYVMNVEELASLWHFPLGDVKALVIKKSEFKKAEAPFALPVGDEDIFPREGDSTAVGIESDEEEAAEAQSLPSTTQDESVKLESKEVDLEEDYGPPDNLPVG